MSIFPSELENGFMLLLLFSAIDGLDKGVEKSEENGDDGSALPPDPTLPEWVGENNDGIPGNIRFLAKI